jgi:hypothetical protein
MKNKAISFTYAIGVDSLGQQITITHYLTEIK